MRYLYGLFLMVAVWAAALAPVSAAETLPDLEGAVILTVSGLDSQEFPDGMMEFDEGRLRALGAEVLRTSTVWTEGVHEFTGVTLKDLVRYLGLDRASGSLRAVALNDYAVDIPLDPEAIEGPLLAYEMDGRPMPVRDKGPLWIIYPFDANPEYRSEVNYTRSIWQLTRIEVHR